MKQNIFLYFMGTAGSGKTTLVNTFLKWCQLHSLDAITVNLDPGVRSVPYKPDVDIRDWISLTEIMESHDLGPNGAQIACADMIALNIGEIKEQVEGFKSDYILIDIPGQLELFVFRMYRCCWTEFSDGTGDPNAGKGCAIFSVEER